MLDDHGKSLHGHLIDESREVAQFLEGSFGEGQLFFQISLMSHMEVNGLTALVGLFSMFYVQLQLLVSLVAVVPHLTTKPENQCNNKIRYFWFILSR